MKEEIATVREIAKDRGIAVTYWLGETSYAVSEITLINEISRVDENTVQIWKIE